MSNPLLLNLSQNILELLKDNDYDIKIEVGKDDNVKIFHVHINILRCHSSYLLRDLASNKGSNNDLAHIKFSNISLEIFQIILK